MGDFTRQVSRNSPNALAVASPRNGTAFTGN